MRLDPKLLWDDCLTVIKDIIPEAAFDAWFKPIIPVSYENPNFTIQVPSQFFYEYLEEKYVNVLRMTLNRVIGEGTVLKYRVVLNGQAKAPIYSGEEPKGLLSHNPNKVDVTKAPGPFKVASQDIDSQLNPRYNFGNFQEGDSNRLVRAVSEMIAKEPGQTAYNPMFIYGPSGVGKTHICHAIGVKIRELFPEKRVLYTSSNIFRLQYTDAVRRNTTNDFLSFYQSIDALLIDDIHELIGLTKTQEIFFQIFKNLHQLGKQIVLTCDRAPVDLQGMEERLISRLKMGMTAPIGRPDLDLRRKILSKKISNEGLDIPNDVFEFIVQNVTENVRDLEGILVSLIANSVITNKDIDISLAKQVIGQSILLEHKQFTVKKILETVCNYFNLNESLVHTKSRKQEIVQMRQIAMYLSKKYTDSSLAHIGKVIGNKDHATVLHSINTVKDQLDINKAFRSTMEAIELCMKN